MIKETFESELFPGIKIEVCKGDEETQGDLPIDHCRVNVLNLAGGVASSKDYLPWPPLPEDESL